MSHSRQGPSLYQRQFSPRIDTDINANADQVRALVVSPHPDDDVIAMGGTIAKLIAGGHRVCSVYVTNGGGSLRTLNISDQKIVRIRRREARKAALAVLRMSKVYFLQPIHVTQREFDDANVLRARVKLRRIMLQEKPTRIYLPHPREAHLTHRRTTELVTEVLESMKGLNPDVWGYEVWTPIERPDLVVDITQFSEKKGMAIQVHRTQLGEKAYDEAVLGLNRYRAAFLDPYQPENSRYVEAFVRVR